MRSISLVQKLEVDYKGSIFKNAVCLVDIDGDGCNEFCIGFTNGDLQAYKGHDRARPWKVSKGLGSLVVLCGGAVRSPEETLLCTLNSEGRCSLFDAKDHVDDDFLNASYEGSYCSRPSSPTNELRLIHKECLLPNAKVAILEDIDNDGIAELIVGYTDRYVRIFKWQVREEDHLIDEYETSKQNITKQTSNDTDKKSALSFSLSMSKEPKKECNSIKSVQRSEHTAHEISDVVDGDRCCMGSPYYHPVGSFVMVKQFSLLGQIGSLAVCKTAEGLNQLIVSQPNGGYCILGQYDQDNGFTENVSTPSSDSPISGNQDSYPTFYPITAYNDRSFQNHHINTEIIGGIKRQNKVTGVIGLCTHDGNFILLDNTYFSGKNPVKNSSKNHWFSMSKVDITDDGDDEIILCDLNGMTYIIDKERNVVSYNFNENIAAFCAGFYGNSPCLCYVTLSGKLHLYYDVWIDAVKVRCVHAALIEKIKDRPELHYILELFKSRNDEIDHVKLQNFVKNAWTLGT